MATSLASGSVFMGVQRVFQAGERLLVNHAELVRLESREQIASVVTRFGFLAVGCWFLLSAWLGLVVTVIVAFDTVPLATRIGAATFVQALVGLGLCLGARRVKRGGGDAS